MKILLTLFFLSLSMFSEQAKKGHKECKNNCYLGGTFFSEPLDHNRCCNPDKKDENCEYYAPMLNSMVCFRCALGFQWDNNNCVEFGQVKTSKEGTLRFLFIPTFEIEK